MQLKQKLFAIKDCRQGTFRSPFFHCSAVEVLRELPHSIPSDNLLRKCAEDFSLWIIGELDLETGVVDRLDPPQFIANMCELFPVQ